MRGQSLTSLLPMLKAELSMSQDASNTASDSHLKILMANTQRWLASEYDFPFLQHRWDVPVVDGSRFLAFPTATSSTGDVAAITAAINWERPVMVESYWGVHWRPLDYGIGINEYNFLNPETGSKSSPIQRWRFATDTSESSNVDKFEIWPVSSTTQTVRFTGQRDLVAFSAGSDLADLDGMLLVYFTAAHEAMKLQLPSAQFLMTKAQERLRRIIGAYPVSSKRTILGNNLYEQDRLRRLAPIVAVA